MTISWVSFAIGAGLGAALGILADWQLGTRWRKRSERRELHKEYHSLAGHYVAHRITEDGIHEPTGGTVELAWEPRDAVFDATAFLANGHAEWHSYIRMSRHFKGTGTGHYNYVDSIHGGIQQLIYSKQTRAFNVMGTSHTRKEFVHYWKLKE